MAKRKELVDLALTDIGEELVESFIELLCPKYFKISAWDDEQASGRNMPTLPPKRHVTPTPQK